jgi:hypothetical protein
MTSASANLQFFILDVCGLICFPDLGNVKFGYIVLHPKTPMTVKGLGWHGVIKYFRRSYDDAVQDGGLLRVTVSDACSIPLCGNVDSSWIYQCSSLNYVFVLDKSVVINIVW